MVVVVPVVVVVVVVVVLVVVVVVVVVLEYQGEILFAGCLTQAQTDAPMCCGLL